jgi:pyruvate dehydrogenase E2 component (dihydrolipoamide acetyltransferase)
MLGRTVTEARLTRWLIADGAWVEKGDSVLLLETEKIECEVEAEGPGRLRHLAIEGSVFSPEVVVGCLLGEGEELPAEYRDAAERVLMARPSNPTASEEGVIPYEGMRRTIGERLRKGLHEIAQVTITMEADMTEAAALLGQLRAEWRREGVHVTYTDLIVKACAIALSEHRGVNAMLDGDVIRLLPEINIGIAVALDEGLIVPVVHRADEKDLREIAIAVHELAQRAREGTLTVDDVTGGTFGITNLGMLDVDVFTPIVNPPQAALLGVGRIKEVPAFDGDQVVKRSVTNLSLSFDHRIVDGAPAARFLQRIKRLLERPSVLTASS